MALSTQHDVGVEGCLEFCKGIVVGATKLAALSEAKLQAIQRDVNETMDLYGAAAAQVNNSDRMTSSLWLLK